MNISDTIKSNEVNKDFAFKGRTCIELFDAETGELILKQEDENTYNSRLQNMGYYLLFAAPRGGTGASFPTYTGNLTPSVVTNDSVAFVATATTALTSRNGNASGNTIGNFSTQFGSMLLTTNTTTQTSTGNPSGITVSWADIRYYTATYNDYYECGVLNINESYISDTTLHIVVDYDEYHANTSFDAIWIYPGRANGQYGLLHGYRYFGSESTTLTLPQLSTFISGVVDLDGRYRLVFFSTSSTVNRTVFNALGIFDSFTGTFTNTYSYPEQQTLGVIIGYDHANQILYTVIEGTAWVANTATKNTWWADATAENNRPYVASFDMANNVFTELIDIRSSLNLVAADFNFVGSSGLAIAYGKNSSNGAYLFVQASGFTNSTNTAVSCHVLVYRFNIDTLDIQYLFRINNLASVPFSTTSVNVSIIPTSNRVVLFGNVLILSDGLEGNNSYAYQRATAYDLANGSQITSTALSASTTSTVFQNITNYGGKEGINSNGNSAIGYVFNSQSAWLDHKDAIYGINGAYNGMYNPTTQGVPPINSVINKYYYARSNWTTHNKLSAPVTKTSANTMRITYDITLDSLQSTVWKSLM